MGSIVAVEETEEEWEVADIAEVEPALLIRGQTCCSGKDLSPVGIVKNPDGSLERATTMQQSSSMTKKERMELRLAQANSTSKDLQSLCRTDSQYYTIHTLHSNNIHK